MNLKFFLFLLFFRKNLQKLFKTHKKHNSILRKLKMPIPMPTISMPIEMPEYRPAETTPIVINSPKAKRMEMLSRPIAPTFKQKPIVFVPEILIP